jgi:hypothetical protein
METYGYEVEEIKKELQQWFIVKMTSKAVANVTCIGVRKTVGRIMAWIKEFRLFTSLFWLFFSGLNPF